MDVVDICGPQFESESCQSLDAEAAVPGVSEAVEVAPEMRELDPADTHLVIRGVSVSQPRTVVCFQ